MSTPKRESSPRLRIFLVENHPDTSRYLTKFLKGLGHFVDTAESMNAALIAIPLQEWDLLISDIGLPDGSGWELLEKAQFRRPVYAAAISGFGTPADIERSMAAGYRKHIVKPFGIAALKQVLEEAALELPTAETQRA